MQPTPPYRGPGAPPSGAAAAAAAAPPHRAPLSALAEGRRQVVALRAQVYLETPRTFVGMLPESSMLVGSCLESAEVARLSWLSRAFRGSDLYWEGWASLRIANVAEGRGREAARDYHRRLGECVGRAFKATYGPEGVPSIPRAAYGLEGVPSIPRLMAVIKSEEHRLRMEGSIALFIEDKLIDCALILVKRCDDQEFRDVLIDDKARRLAIRERSEVLTGALLEKAAGAAGKPFRSSCVQAAVEEKQIDVALRFLRMGPIDDLTVRFIFNKHMGALAAHSDSDQVMEVVEQLLRYHKPQERLETFSIAEEEAIGAIALSPHSQALEILLKNYPEAAFPAPFLLELATQIVGQRRYLTNLLALLARGPCDRDMIGELLMKALRLAPVPERQLEITAALPAIQQFMPHLVEFLRRAQAAHQLITAAKGRECRERWRSSVNIDGFTVVARDPTHSTLAYLENTRLAYRQAALLMMGSSDAHIIQRVRVLSARITDAESSGPREAPVSSDPQLVENELLETVRFLITFARERHLTITQKVLDAAFEMAASSGYFRVAEALLHPGIERAVLMRSLHRVARCEALALFIPIFNDARPTLAEWGELHALSAGEIREFLESHKPAS